jgi:LCP family protein required for cell wall assembly
MSEHNTTSNGAPKPSSLNKTLKPEPIQADPVADAVFVTDNNKKAKIKYSRLKRQILSHVGLVRFFLLTFLILFFTAAGLFAYNAYKRFNVPYYYNIASNFITAPVSQLAQHNGRTNILVMGKAGGVHDGPDLTDTIMLISVGLNDDSVKIISIPRDIWVPEMRAKINSAYYWGIQKNVGGIPFAKAEASQIVGMPIQYGAVIDFSGFKEIIDVLGGVTVDVENGFTDPMYPIAGRENDTCGGRDPKYLCRYEALTFNPGPQLMDGETALKFVRSRHAEGVEGTDLARSARQGKVIQAVKNKLTDKDIYMDFGKDAALIKVVLKSVETDIDYPTAAILARRVYESQNSIKSYVIPEELLINIEKSPIYDMQSVFVPKAGNGKWQEITKWVETTLINNQ